MHTIDWIIVVAYLVYVVVDGIRRAKGTKEIEGYFLANRDLPWWAVGLSVMATQLSAVTMIGTTGQGATDGLRFIQFYFGLPLAMVILGVTLVPFLHRAKVFTAYEYLERRFDSKTRSLTAFLFLVSRGMSCGAIIAAPAVVFSAIFGWSIAWSVALMGIPTVIYTMIGGVQAVTWADVKQMVLIVGAIIAMIVVVLIKLPVDPDTALRLAGATGRMQAFDFSFNLNETYTFWSGLIGGTFLMMSYFGTDQSQVQRFLTARSVTEARSSLLMSAYWKIPLQALVLLVGVLMFLFFLYTPSPMLFNSVHEREIRQGPAAAEYRELESRFEAASASRSAAARVMTRAEAAGDVRSLEVAKSEFQRQDTEVRAVRGEAIALVRMTTGDAAYSDVNYVFPTFITRHMPIGLPGLLIAAILAAAMSTIAGELNSLSTATVIDFYRRFVRTEASDAHFLWVSRLATGFWGLFASIVAVWAAELGSLIEVVNRFGSFFYGSILGVFILAVGFSRATANGAFIGLIAGMSAVAWAATSTNVAFLWHNVIGAVVVVIVGLAVSLVTRR